MSFRFVAVFLFLTLPFRFAQAQETKDTLAYFTPQKLDAISDIINTSKLYLGKPYRFKNEKGNLMDCSGFVGYVFSQHQIVLPRSSRAIATVVERIKFEDIQNGDLLFFKGRNISSSSVGHVSLVVEKSTDYIEMIHSSRSGIVVDKYPSKYYKDRFLFAGRIPALFPHNQSSDSTARSAGMFILNDTLRIDSSFLREKIFFEHQKIDSVPILKIDASKPKINDTK